MKRCPECGRDYNDDSMSFCLDDGSELLFGPASMDEPATAILHTTAAPGEAPTRAQIQITDQTAILPSGTGDVTPKPRGFDKRLLFAPLALAVIILGGFFGYRYVTPAKQIESIAVMPFVNESGNADVEYLSDGMTETLIKSLSELPNLNVKPRSSVFRYKGKDTDMKTIGKELNVEAILNGRVIQRGDQLTLSLELVDVKNDKVLWTESYQRKQSDIVSLQSEIAKDVSTKLKLKLSGADEAKVAKASTVNPEAYQAYLKGRYYWNRRTAENLKKAIEQFKIATDRDPNYALAYVGLADCYAILNNLTGTPLSEALPQAKAYAERAIAIDDQLGEPHASLGLIYQKLWKWAEAEQEYKRAIELNPNYATAYQWHSLLLRDLGRFDEVALMIKRAKELDPLSSPINSNLSTVYLIQKDYDASIENSLKLIELDPNFSYSYVILGLSYLKKGRTTEAITNLEKAVELSNRDVGLSELGYGYGVTGKRAEANAIAKELEEKYASKESNGFYVAGVYAGLADKDKAFEWLEKDIQTKSGNISNIRWAIPFESLRDDPRYKDLLKRMGLPE
ncbi:MAG: tetratricopeptide repeat protein [Chloracidobacterium sp.]|nr:tetratricopeptide repeat protein [Chloracidobacterium sp.]